MSSLVQMPSRSGCPHAVRGAFQFGILGLGGSRLGRNRAQRRRRHRRTEPAAATQAPASSAARRGGSGAAGACSCASVIRSREATRHERHGQPGGRQPAGTDTGFLRHFRVTPWADPRAQLCTADPGTAIFPWRHPTRHPGSSGYVWPYTLGRSDEPFAMARGGRYSFVEASVMRTSLIAVVGSLLLASAASAADAPTFYKDVLPILQANCQTCHRPGEVAPMSLAHLRAGATVGARDQDRRRLEADAAVVCRSRLRASGQRAPARRARDQHARRVGRHRRAGRRPGDGAAAAHVRERLEHQARRHRRDAEAVRRPRARHRQLQVHRRQRRTSQRTCG